MAYNGFPATYQPMYYTPYQPQPVQMMPQQPMPQQMPAQAVQQPVQPSQPVSNGIIWVQGEAGAKSHLVAPNTTVALWDSEAQRIFLKSADAAGMPSMKILNYTIEETPSIGATAQRAVNAAVSPRAPEQPTINPEVQKALEAQISGVRSDLDAIRAEMETFRGDLYGIAGKKPASRKKDGGSDE